MAGGDAPGGALPAAREAASTRPQEHKLSVQVIICRAGAHQLLHVTQVEACVRPVVMRLAARYLLRERRRGAALDHVANFHLRNGAAVARLNWRADPSARGLSGSVGIMVNYECGPPSTMFPAETLSSNGMGLLGASVLRSRL